MHHRKESGIGQASSATGEVQARGEDAGGPSDRSEFSWQWARHHLDGLPGDRGLNIAHEAVDRHVAAGRGDKAALRCVAADLSVTTVTYEGLARRSNRFANALRSLGVGRGECVATLLGRCPELYVTVMGTLKNTSVFCPLFAAFGPEPVEERLRLGDVRVLVTTRELYTRKVAERRDELSGLRHVLIVGSDSEPTSGTLAFDELLARSEDSFTIPQTDPQDMALLHFTSGTTGTPKGAVHVHEAVVAHYATAASVFDLRADDVFWCTADPGWVTGTSYGVIAPLTHGVTTVVDAGEYSARRWYSVLAEHRVTVWYTAPTAIRMLMRATPRGTAPELPRSFDLSALRFIASVGEPLNPEAVRWGEEILSLPVHDNWWQTETGSIMIANVPGTQIRPGSMGRPLPGVEAAVLERGPNGRAQVVGGRVHVLDGPGAEGELALRPGWPSMFRGYLNAEARYRACFADGWYLTGDIARRDTDGYYWFVARADDVIKSAGHLIGPFEVESALMEHRAVAEAGVIGCPDPVAGEVVKAFVTLEPGFEADAGLARDITAFARRRLGPAMAPRSVSFDQHLPKTRSGKVMRRLLRARELGLPEGDVSALEETK
ncbi:acetate--CoA ligase [Actinacidiphila bryophytorum]|uniref:acetate--CoA ligase n=1 Tax=Actinacidiphila bryophytorum TaxID=1436133 RepID=A0A9W4E484_9ACTN|nr:acetate--CoA ligase [Actinacidiphila bryophytorum]MBM9438423.1 acetate--CoA ligase [Actinacidiphila bryophytorum]MBN6542303.1 acetate--CoA ligase [Actinacidiphila bryophytorum]CAG7613736.1 Acetyl-coenzyme A synthetase [Actinacidiphila bryophytorum]